MPLPFDSIYLYNKFISENEKHGSVSFLDTKTMRNPDAMVKSKPVLKDKGTHTDTYFHFHFSPLPPPPSSFPSSLFLTGANSIPSTKAVKMHLKNNDNSDQFRRTCQNQHLQISAKSAEFYVALSAHIDGIAERIARTLTHSMLGPCFQDAGCLA